MESSAKADIATHFRAAKSPDASLNTRKVNSQARSLISNMDNKDDLSGTYFDKIILSPQMKFRQADARGAAGTSFQQRFQKRMDKYK